MSQIVRVPRCSTNKCNISVVEQGHKQPVKCHTGPTGSIGMTGPTGPSGDGLSCSIENDNVGNFVSVCTDHNIYAYAHSGLAFSTTLFDSSVGPAFGVTGFYFNTAKSAFKFGESDATSWLDSNTGIDSYSSGFQTVSSGNYSHSEGMNTGAYGLAGHAEGRQSFATGEYSHSEGYGCVSGYRSHTEGDNCNAENTSHAEGSQGSAMGSVSHTEGLRCITDESTFGSHAGGIDSMAICTGSFARAGGGFMGITGPTGQMGSGTCQFMMVYMGLEANMAETGLPFKILHDSTELVMPTNTAWFIRADIIGYKTEGFGGMATTGFILGQYVNEAGVVSEISTQSPNFTSVGMGTPIFNIVGTTVRLETFEIFFDTFARWAATIHITSVSF